MHVVSLFVFVVSKLFLFVSFLKFKCILFVVLFSSLFFSLRYFVLVVNSVFCCRCESMFCGIVTLFRQWFLHFKCHWPRTIHWIRKDNPVIAFWNSFTNERFWAGNNALEEFSIWHFLKFNCHATISKNKQLSSWWLAKLLALRNL